MDDRRGIQSLFRVIDAQGRETDLIERDRERLFFPSLLGLAAYSILSAAFYVLVQRDIFSIAEGGHSAAYAADIHALVSFGFIPLSIASLILLFVRPAPSLVLGRTRDRWSFLFSPVLGLLAGLLVWCIRELVSSWSGSVGRYIDVPDFLARGSHYFNRSVPEMFLLIFSSVVVPATALELLLRGVSLPGFVAGAGWRLSSLVVAVIASLASFVGTGYVILFILLLLSSWVRSACDSLPASSLTTMGFSFALLFSEKIFSAAGTALFGSISMDASKYRIFLLSCVMILTLFLIAPAAFIQGVGNRAKSASDAENGGRRRMRGKGSPRAIVMVATGFFLVLVLVLCQILVNR